MANFNNGESKVSGSARRAALRGLDPRSLTRAEAQRVVASTQDRRRLGVFLAQHGNEHVKRQAHWKLAEQSERDNVCSLRFVMGALASGDFSAFVEVERAEKRSEASRKAAATRRAKKAAQAS